jgi:hypothetical protein
MTHLSNAFVVDAQRSSVHNLKERELRQPESKVEKLNLSLGFLSELYGVSPLSVLALSR